MGERVYVLRTDDIVRTKISWMHRQPNFLTYGAPLRALRARESSAFNSKFRRQHTKLATKGDTGSHYQSVQYGFNVTHP